MTRLTKDDLAQMNRDYFQSLEPERLVVVTEKLHQLAVEQYERLEQNSHNSSRPPSSDDPYQTPPAQYPAQDTQQRTDEDESTAQELPVSSGETPMPSAESDAQSTQVGETDEADPQATRTPKKSAGKQPGAPGKWRSTPLVSQQTIPHFPEHCAACNEKLNTDPELKPYMGYYTLELEQQESGFRIRCDLHHYYEMGCTCGHQTKARPGEGYVSSVEGRKRDLKIHEYTLVGPVLATLIASLSVRHRMSRAKIHEFLIDWANTPLSIGTIERCIREAGIACTPVVEELVEQLQDAQLLHLDETPWYEKGQLRYLWVALNATIAVFYIGTRKKEELLALVTSAFVGWLVSDGYRVYRAHEKRQRCLAHLIRKAIALSGAVDKQVQKMGDWFLRELRGLIKTMAEAGEETTAEAYPILARLKRASLLGKDSEHAKLRALAREILNDWDAVIAFVKHPGLPPTNNEAERALRHAVISRRITHGTRTSEGSLAYSNLLSVIETCRLRKINPWDYIASVIKQARKGLSVPPIPIVQDIAA